MPAPRYITNDSEMIAPGTYVKENAPASPVRGQRNRVVGLAGQCVRGPVGKTVVCTSYKRFEEVFGGRDRNTKGGTVLGHIWRALQGRRWGKLVIARVAASDAVAASFTLEAAAGGAGAQIVRVDAANPGAWGGDVQIKVVAASNGNANHWNLLVKMYGTVKVYENLNTFSATDNNLNVVLGNDDANLITITKLANGRPVNNAASTDGADTLGFVSLGQVIANYVSVAGSDGTIADGAYTIADGPMERINNFRGVHACAVVGRSNAAIRAAAETLANGATQRCWFICMDSEASTLAQAITERGTRSGGRLTLFWNHPWVTDPVTKEEIVEEPFVNQLSIISQTDPDIHLGDYDNAPLTKYLRRVTWEMDDTDRDSATTAKLSFIHRDEDANGNPVIICGNAVTCDNSVNNRELDGRYMKDFILDACARRIQGDQFKGNTVENRENRAAQIRTFLSDLAKNSRYIMKDETTGKPQFTYVNDGSVNTVIDQATGLQKELLIAKLIPKNIQIQLNATVGVDATITEQ